MKAAGKRALRLRKTGAAGSQTHVSLRQAIAPIVDFVFPPRCPACGDAIAGGAPNGDDALCFTCWGKLAMPGEPCCKGCQRPFPADRIGADELCRQCLTEPPLHDGIVAATIYGEISRQLILDLKHAGRIALAGPMGRTMAARLAGRMNDPLVVPVPLHRWRLWKRGYNQSALLGRALAKGAGWEFAPDMLARVRKTPSLGGLDKVQRRSALEGAIVVARKGLLANREIVLVDDVLTSGATSDACVRALKSVGAGRVVIACYARVLGKEG